MIAVAIFAGAFLLGLAWEWTLARRFGRRIYPELSEIDWALWAAFGWAVLVLSAAVTVAVVT